MYVTTLHTGNAGLQGKVFHSGVVVSVLLTSCVQSHLLPDTLVLKRDNPKPRSLWPLDGHAGCFCCMSLLLMMFLVRLFHFGTSGTTNISGHAIEKHGLWIESVLLWNKKKVFYFLCCFISTFTEVMSSWVLTGNLILWCWPSGTLLGFDGKCPSDADRPELRMTQRCWKMHRTARSNFTLEANRKRSSYWKHYRRHSLSMWH